MGMKVFCVGGAVRDALLGLPFKDHDYVVVGATPEQLLALGYTPVGQDFPVFLHPDTHEEYALARTERKSAPGYHGFVFHCAADVTLEQDLYRRDLTINAMARGDDGSLVDPYGGQQDLAARVLRHVSVAFAEDPVRILRIARFAARFSDFSVAAETMELMRSMVLAGEVDALVPERVWQEVARGLMEKTPSRMIDVLRECGALERIMPELHSLWGVPQPARYHPEIDTGKHVMLVLDYAASQNFSVGVRWAALLHDLGKGTSPVENWPHHHGHEGRGEELARQLCTRLKTPKDVRDLAMMTAREHGNIGRAFDLRADTIVRLLERCDAFRKPARFVDMLCAAASDWFGRADLPDLQFPQFAYMERALAAAQAVPVGQIAAEMARRFPGQVQRIPEQIHAARILAVQQMKQNSSTAV